MLLLCYLHPPKSFKLRALCWRPRPKKADEKEQNAALIPSRAHSLLLLPLSCSFLHSLAHSQFLHRFSARPFGPWPMARLLLLPLTAPQFRFCAPSGSKLPMRTSLWLVAAWLECLPPTDRPIPSPPSAQLLCWPLHTPLGPGGRAALERSEHNPMGLEQPVDGSRTGMKLWGEQSSSKSRGWRKWRGWAELAVG
jgi:hypothetical protein